MKIAVCVSHVPDTATKIKIASDSLNIERAGVAYVLNPYDEFAVEQALRTRDEVGGEVIVISVGDTQSAETIRKALAMGANSGVLLKHIGYADSYSVAASLAGEIKSLGCELVFMGKQSVDYDNSVVGQLTAGFLGYNSISVCTAFKLSGNKIDAEREIEGGKEVIISQLPAVITTQKGLNDPRYPNLKGIMEAKRKPLIEKPANIASSHVELIRLKQTGSKKSGRILGSDKSAVTELVRLLKEEAKVI